MTDPLHLATRPAKATTNHRRAPRQSVLTKGLLIHGRSSLSVPCTIRDVSSLGARVKLSTPEILSRPIYLVIVRNGAAFEAEIAWAKSGELGLQFKGRLNLGAPKTDIEKIAAGLWQAQPQKP
ncbi:MAG TPA: PilZ domain-containing protein [Phenylobacterium sp.]